MHRRVPLRELKLVRKVQISDQRYSGVLAVRTGGILTWPSAFSTRNGYGLRCEFNSSFTSSIDRNSPPR